MPTSTRIKRPTSRRTIKPADPKIQEAKTPEPACPAPTPAARPPENPNQCEGAAERPHVEAPHRPHPLALNPREGQWFNDVTCVGPHDGWFSFGESGNPPFGMPVQLCLMRVPSMELEQVAVGQRTRHIIPGVEKEGWNVIGAFAARNGCGHTHWKPLSPPPLCVKLVGPRP